MVLEIAGGKKECYVETKNLDGETNLKVKEVPEFLQGRKEFWLDPNFECLIDCGTPNKYLEDFHGSLITSQKISSHADEKQTSFVDVKHLLLRGCRLRTTEWVKAVVVYTGNDTKIQLNSCESE